MAERPEASRGRRGANYFAFGSSTPRMASESKIDSSKRSASHASLVRRPNNTLDVTDAMSGGMCVQNRATSAINLSRGSPAANKAGMQHVEHAFFSSLLCFTWLILFFVILFCIFLFPLSGYVFEHHNDAIVWILN